MCLTLSIANNCYIINIYCMWIIVTFWMCITCSWWLLHPECVLHVFPAADDFYILHVFYKFANECYIPKLCNTCPVYLLYYTCPVYLLYYTCSMYLLIVTYLTVRMTGKTSVSDCSFHGPGWTVTPLLPSVETAWHSTLHRTWHSAHCNSVLTCCTSGRINYSITATFVSKSKVAFTFSLKKILSWSEIF